MCSFAKHCLWKRTCFFLNSLEHTPNTHPPKYPYSAGAVGSRDGYLGYYSNYFVFWKKMSVPIGSCFLSKLHIGRFFKVSGFAEGCGMPVSVVTPGLLQFPFWGPRLGKMPRAPWIYVRHSLMGAMGKTTMAALKGIFSGPWQPWKESFQGKMVIHNDESSWFTMMNHQFTMMDHDGSSW